MDRVSPVRDRNSGFIILIIIFSHYNELVFNLFKFSAAKI